MNGGNRQDTPRERNEQSLADKFADRLPFFINVYFSLIVITSFREFAEEFQWTTQPRFDIGELSQIFVSLSFICALFWIVTDWLAYNWLIVRHPYSVTLAGFARFFIDIVGFSLMFAVMNFSFLADEVDSYQWFIFGMALWHLIIVTWHVAALLTLGEQVLDIKRAIKTFLMQLRVAFSTHQDQVSGWRGSDAVWHLFRSSIYFVLGLLYVLLVIDKVGDAADKSSSYYVLICLTYFAIIVLNSHRVAQVRRQVLGHSFCTRLPGFLGI